jgi:hypothetical protein
MDLRQFEVEEREVRRTAAHEAMDRIDTAAKAQLLSMPAGQLRVRVGIATVKMVDLLAAIDAMVDEGYVDTRNAIDDELRRINRDASRTGKLPEVLR